MQAAALLTGLVALGLSACSPPAVQPVPPHPVTDAAESYRQYTDGIDRSSSREFLLILANGDAPLTAQLESTFEQAADARTHPEGASVLPELAGVYPYHLWGAVIERMRELQLVSDFDPRAHSVFDPRVVRLRFLSDSAASSWRALRRHRELTCGIVHAYHQEASTWPTSPRWGVPGCTEPALL